MKELGTMYNIQVQSRVSTLEHEMFQCFDKDKAIEIAEYLGKLMEDGVIGFQDRDWESENEDMFLQRLDIFVEEVNWDTKQNTIVYTTKGI